MAVDDPQRMVKLMNFTQRIAQAAKMVLPQAQHEADRIKVPLQFLHHDGAQAKCISCNHLNNDDSDQHSPQRGGNFAHQREQTINAARQRSGWQHQARRPGDGGG